MEAASPLLRVSLRLTKDILVTLIIIVILTINQYWIIENTLVELFKKENKLVDTIAGRDKKKNSFVKALKNMKMIPSKE